MLAALENGVKGGKWFSLIDKVYRLGTLRAAWRRVQANGGAAGVDGQSIEQFEAGAERYLGELERRFPKGMARSAHWEFLRLRTASFRRR
jgi:RNA-directed DNA polymerase